MSKVNIKNYSQMNLYYFDHKQGTKKELIKGTFITKKLQAKELEIQEAWWLEFGKETGHIIMFVHCSQEKHIKTWINWADVDKRKFVIFVSSQPPVRISKNVNDGIYCLPKHPNQYSKFDKATEFINSCALGSPKWELFEPPSYPEHLVAAYLLQLTNNWVKKNKDGKNYNIKMGEKFWETALEEFKNWNDTLGDKVSVNDDFTISLTDSHEQVSQLLSKIA